MTERAAPRHEITIVGRVRMGGIARDVTVLDLSEHGCRFHDRFSTLPVGAAVTLRLGPFGPIGASVKWRRGEYLGVQFARPLYAPVLDHIRAHFDLGQRDDASARSALQ